MPERLEPVTFTVPMGTQTISWDAREVLLAKLEQKQTEAWLAKHWPELGFKSNAAAIRASIEAVGASRPVELSADETPLLCKLLKFWPMTHEGVSDGMRTEPPRPPRRSREGRPRGMDRRAVVGRRRPRPGRVAVEAMGPYRARRTTTTTTVRSATPASRTGRRSTMTSMRAGSAATKPATKLGLRRLLREAAANVRLDGRHAAVAETSE